MQSNRKTVRVATDVGGTFTDLVYFESDPETGQQSLRTAKVDTTPPNFAEGILNVFKKPTLRWKKLIFSLTAPRW